MLLAGLLAVLAAIAVTPVGKEWFDDLWPTVSDTFLSSTKEAT